MSQLLGIDLGAFSVKVLLATEAGQTLGSGSAEYPIRGAQPALAADRGRRVLLAGGGVGLFDPGSTAQTWAAYGPPVEPDGERQALYQALLALFCSAYQKHRADFCQLQNIEGHNDNGDPPRVYKAVAYLLQK